MMRVTSMLLLLLAATLAGCAADDDDGGEATSSSSSSSSTTTDTQPFDPCPGVVAPLLVPGYTEHGGDWGVVPSGEGRTDVICGKATQALSSLVRDVGNYSDLDLNVSFNMQDGDSGAGVVLHFEGTQDYNIVRYSPREQGWHIFTVIAGNRQKQDAGSVTPPTTNPELDQWVELRVRSVGGHVEAWDGTVKVIDCMLPAEASHSGQVGLFLRDAGMSAFFDDLEVSGQSS